MKQTLLISAFTMACSQPFVLGTSTGESTEQTTSSWLTTSSTSSFPEEKSPCPNPLKSYDEAAIKYYGFSAYPEEVPGAAITYQFGPWLQNEVISGFSVESVSSLESEIKAAIWLENLMSGQNGEWPSPTQDPNAIATIFPVTTMISVAGYTMVEVQLPFDLVVPSGNIVYIAFVLDTQQQTFSVREDLVCGEDRTWYYRPVGCAAYGGPHWATLAQPKCVPAYNANYVIGIVLKK